MPVTAGALDTPHLRSRQNASRCAAASPRPAVKDPVDHLRDRLVLSQAARQQQTVSTIPAVIPAAVTPPAKNLSTAELASLGENDKAAFFAALRPAAEEAEKTYGVPAEVTLAQAALESGWGQSCIGGYNIFGIKGSGPAGTVAKKTQEWVNGAYETITANFAKYSDFYQAIVEHGKRFHNGYYDKAVEQFSQDHSYRNFIGNIQGIYATDPKYSSKLLSIIDQYGLAQA